MPFFVLLQNVVYLAPKYFYDMKCLPILVVVSLFVFSLAANIAPFCFHRLFFGVYFCFVACCFVEICIYVRVGGTETLASGHRAGRNIICPAPHTYILMCDCGCVFRCPIIFSGSHVWGTFVFVSLKIMYIFSTFACFVFAYRVWRSFACNSRLAINVLGPRIHSDVRMLAVWLAGWLICCEIVILLLQWLRAMRRMSNVSVPWP